MIGARECGFGVYEIVAEMEKDWGSGRRRRLTYLFTVTPFARGLCAFFFRHGDLGSCQCGVRIGVKE